MPASLLHDIIPLGETVVCYVTMVIPYLINVNKMIHGSFVLHHQHILSLPLAVYLLATVTVMSIGNIATNLLFSVEEKKKLPEHYSE